MDISNFISGVTANISDKTLPRTISASTVGNAIIELAELSASAVTSNNILISDVQADLNTLSKSLENIADPVYETLTGVTNSSQGFYSYNTGAWNVFSGFYTVKYDILQVKGELYAGGRTNGTNMALVVYFDASNAYVGYEIRGGSSALNKIREKITPPTNARYVAVCSYGSTYPVKLEELSFAFPDEPLSKYRTDIDSVQTSINSLKTPVYTTQSGELLETQGFYAYGTGVWTNFSGYRTSVFDIQGISGVPYAGGRTSGTAMALAVYFDASNVYLGFEVRGQTAQQAYNRYQLNPPIGTRFIAICTNSNSLYPAKLEMLNQVMISATDVALANARNQWRGKKIVWLGTSVPFGQNATKSYPQEAADKLGFTLINASVPGQAIHITNSGEIQANGSTALSKAEYEALGITIASSPLAYTPGGTYNNYYRTWENIFTPENADADLWVFDIVPNNGTTALNSTADWDAFNKSTWAYTDGSTFADHRKTVLGAMLFLMDKMYTLNPNARMVLLSASSFNYSAGVTMFQTLASQWNIPYIDIWKKINRSPKSLNVIKSLSGTDDHPSTFAHELLGKMLTNELLLVQ